MRRVSAARPKRPTHQNQVREAAHAAGESEDATNRVLEQFGRATISGLLDLQEVAPQGVGPPGLADAVEQLDQGDQRSVHAVFL
ncbi:hypothetical protein HCN51_24040 [Nonomuraea sp. FMUSA5-5]|uniref:Uncharacterized protein n=1 Tax=Nonomuraea composti TaxID=2720023 RepID=A0ABX1B888_9ACTN|nr:hypothetical protein [Nonomuraea sp. FMUSA5-5]NJP92504.1 hypothetical protein [Nonomuraea sp. FMUSA5-5]